MNIARKIAKNTTVLLIGTTFNKLLGILITVYLARYLGATNFGKYSFVLVYISFFTIFTDFGLTTIITREISKDKNKAEELLGSLLVMRIFLSIFTTILALLIINFLGYSTEIKLAVYLAVITFFITAIGSISLIFQVHLVLEYNVISNLAGGLFQLIFILLLINFKGNFLDFIFVYLFSAFITLFLTIIFAKRLVRPKFKINFSLYKNIFIESLPLGIAFALATVYFNIDMLMLSKMKGNYAVGLYAAAYKFVTLSLFIPSSLMASVFPLMSDYYQNNKNKLNLLYQKSFDYLMLIVLPLSFMITVLADKLIIFLYGEEFIGSILALQILTWAVVLMFISNLVGPLLIVIGKQKTSMVLTFIGVIVNISLNFVLIPKFSFIGSSVATFLTEVVMFLPVMLIVNKHLKFNLEFKIFGKSFFIGLFIGYLLYKLNKFHLLFQIFLGIISYLFFIFIFKVISKDELRLILPLKEKD